MSVILEFSIDGGDFQLGRVLLVSPDVQLELERLVPTGTMIVPFVWVTGGDHGAFEEAVRNHPRVSELHVLDTIGDSGLYRIEWKDAPTDLIEAISEADAVVLEARGDETWAFRLRFFDHDDLSGFHDAVIERGIPIHIDRTYTLTDDLEGGHRFDLSPEQREALVLGLRRGYFDSPSETTLAELAAELDISRQALSDRIRRGNEKVLRIVLFSSVTDPGR